MKMFQINIDGVDGTTGYSMRSDVLSHLWEFLTRYDHEGSSVSLDIGHETGPKETLYDEDVYTKFREGRSV